MRVLILGNRLAEPKLREALTRLLAQLDTQRIQAAVAALRAERDGLIDSALGSRRALSLGALRRLISLLRKLQIELLHIAERSAIWTGILAARY
ncbi:MAG: hypothetical protein ACK4P1_11490, partial [Aggregatilineales bacterium]